MCEIAFSWYSFDGFSVNCILHSYTHVTIALKYVDLLMDGCMVNEISHQSITIADTHTASELN